MYLRKFSRLLMLTILLLPLITFSLFAQAGTYYDAIAPSSPTFISDLESRIRAPYTQISYDQFDETNVTFFASRDTTNGQRVVTCVYSGENYVYTPPFAWGYFSREHTWCQSWFPSGGTTSSMWGSDQHHLFPTQQNQVNGVRNNHPLGIVQNVSSSYLSSKLGTNSSGYTVFEPRNAHKGDAARALLYMSIKYNEVSGDWSFDHLQTYLTSHSEGPEDVATLLAWNKQDPPDKWEVDRNNYVQSIQHNRNPFVDHPEYANYINFNNITPLSPVYASEPTNFPTSVSAVSNPGSITITWTDAAAGTQTPSGYLLVAYNRDNYFLPIDGETYTDDIDLSDGAAVVNLPYGAPDSYSFSGLVSNAHYYFTLFSYYGTTTQINYKINGTLPRANAVYNGTPILEPTIQASNIQVSNITSAGMTLTWSPGNGTSRIVLAHTGAAVDADPVDFNTYTSNPVIGGGSQIGTGNFVVSNGTSNTAVLTELAPNTTYYFKVYEYNGSGGTENYLITSPASANFTTAAVTEPTVQSSGLSFSTVDATDMTLSWTNGNGVYRIVLANAVNAVDSDPVDANNYSSNSVIGLGSQIGTNNFVVYKGTGNSITVSGLTQLSTYYFAVYEFNGSGGNENYLPALPATGSQTTIALPTGTHVIVAEVYGGGGNSGATYKNDYILLYNPTSSPVDLSTWSVQYASAAGNSWTNRTNLTGNILANRYYLIKEHAGGSGSVDLPTPNVTGTIDMSGTAGKVVLAKIQTAVSGPTDANVVDLVAYGTTATPWEGSGPAPATSSTLSDKRKNNGTQDTDDNASDFIAVIPDLSGVPLPVELVTFNADSKGRTINLKWTTATEVNTLRFEVQRTSVTKTGTGNWIYVGTINAHVNSNSPKDYTFIDNNQEAGKYNYRLKIVDKDGSFVLTDVINAEIASPDKFALSQNYPNPFNPNTVISYSLPFDCNVKMSVYDAVGRMVRDVVNENQKAGYHDYNFNAGNLSSGIYFYSIIAIANNGQKNFHSVKKFALIK